MTHPSGNLYFKHPSTGCTFKEINFWCVVFVVDGAEKKKLISL